MIRPRKKMVRPARGVAKLLAALAGAALSASAIAQPAPPQWVTLDPAVGPGTPPAVTVSPASTEDQTILEISIPGFYVEDVVDPVHGTFQKITLPRQTSGIGLLLPAVQKATGAPAVPVLNMLVAIPSDAPTCAVASLAGASTTIAGMRIVPDQPNVDEEENVDPGDNPPFAFDAGAYASTAGYPANIGEVLGPVGHMSSIRVQPVSVKPFTYVASTGQLTVKKNFSVTIAHDGAPLPQTKEHVLLARQYSQLCVNWSTPAASWIKADIYKGDFLFITLDDVIEDLQPLVNQKKERGYRTRVATRADMDYNGNDKLEWTEVRGYIKDWYAEFNESLKYVILVGDVNRIPNAVDPDYGYPSDHYYSCFHDDDFYSDMFVGRLTFNAGQLPDIIGRILAYEEAPPSQDAYYSKGLAIGHEQVSANFVKVLDAAVSIPFPANAPMNFTKVYGTDPVNGYNSVLINALNAGQHIVYYRGHGSPSSLSTWSFPKVSFVDTDLTAQNFPVHPTWCPIFISSACANGALNDSDSICEEWFQRAGNGAVASYGALIGSRRDMNHSFTKHFWQNLRYIGTNTSLASLVVNSQLFAWCDTVGLTEDDWAKNIWTYTLLGDPEMKIWAKNPTPCQPENPPAQIFGGAQTFNLTIKNGHGDPLPGAVVSAFKGGEVAETVYANEMGVATLTINPQTYGTVTIRTYTYDDSTVDTVTRVQVGACPADFDASGFADFDDFNAFVRAFEAGDPSADYDASGFVDFDDFNGFVQVFERGC